MDQMEHGSNIKMDQMEQIQKKGVGNTDDPLPLRKQSKHWCFTLNNYSNDECIQMDQMVQEYCKKYVIGKEVGEEGTPHLQGYIMLHEKLRLTSLKKWNKRINWSICRSPKHSIVYCAKDGEYTFGGIREFELEPLEEYSGEDLPSKDELFAWQLKLLENIKTKDTNRKVFWVYEAEGNVGKTMFSKYLAWHKGANIVQKGKYADIMNYMFNVVKTSMLIIDVPRSSGNSVSYNAIESIKSGIIFNSKYETGQKLIKSPVIIVFSNEFPDTSKLSNDRWLIYKIKEMDLVEVQEE